MERTLSSRQSSGALFGETSTGRRRQAVAFLPQTGNYTTPKRRIAWTVTIHAPIWRPVIKLLTLCRLPCAWFAGTIRRRAACRRTVWGG